MVTFKLKDKSCHLTVYLPRVLKKISLTVSSILSHIVSQSLISGYFLNKPLEKIVLHSYFFYDWCFVNYKLFSYSNWLARKTFLVFFCLLKHADVYMYCMHTCLYSGRERDVARGGAAWSRLAKKLSRYHCKYH